MQLVQLVRPELFQFILLIESSCGEGSASPGACLVFLQTLPLWSERLHRITVGVIVLLVCPSACVVSSASVFTIILWVSLYKPWLARSLLSRPGWPPTRRSTCPCLSNAGIQGVWHYAQPNPASSVFKYSVWKSHNNISSFIAQYFSSPFYWV